MPSYHRKRKIDYEQLIHNSIVGALWDSFWGAPDAKCPKCGSHSVEYYDPLFFAPIRTLKGKRRIKCCTCHFIWRPSRKEKSILERFNPF